MCVSDNKLPSPAKHTKEIAPQSDFHIPAHIIQEGKVRTIVCACVRALNKTTACLSCLPWFLSLGVYFLWCRRNILILMYHPSCYKTLVQPKQFLGKRYTGWFAIAFPTGVRAGIWNLLRVPTIAHLLFAKDSVGSVMLCTNECQQMGRPV